LGSCHYVCIEESGIRALNDFAFLTVFGTHIHAISIENRREHLCRWDSYGVCAAIEHDTLRGHYDLTVINAGELTV
jgi:hypothetical protein